MSDKVIYVDFKSGVKKDSIENQNYSIFKSFYYRIKSLVHFSSSNKPVNGVYNFKKTM